MCRVSCSSEILGFDFNESTGVVLAYKLNYSIELIVTFGVGRCLVVVFVSVNYLVCSRLT